MAFRLRNRFRALLWATLASLTIGSLSAAQPRVAANDTVAVKSETQGGAAAQQPGAPNASPAAIDGFRDARFGMNEEQVRAEIRSDFPAAAASLTSAVNPSEKTTVLSL